MHLIVLDTLLQNIQDVSEEEVLKLVEQAVKENATLERLKGMVVFLNDEMEKRSRSILKGAAANQNLRELELRIMVDH